MSIDDMNEKRIASFTQTLKVEKRVHFTYNEFYYEIFESSCSDGYIVNVFSNDERNEDGDNLEHHHIDGGLCSGSARDAVEFML